jgi:solute carrier family 25 (mitochondrial carnitine/acylcarnitine transporter), member 20/29
MPSDFWAGYISGAVGICVGNPLDVIKVQLQAGHRLSIVSPNPSQFRTPNNLLKGISHFIVWCPALMQFPLE